MMSCETGEKSAKSESRKSRSSRESCKLVFGIR
jgi:hypothetical protein